MGLKTEYSNIKLKKSKKQTYKIIGMLDLKVRISCFETQENQFPNNDYFKSFFVYMPQNNLDIFIPNLFGSKFEIFGPYPPSKKRPPIKIQKI